MTTSWDTLFHLSSFMKHLLIHILPKEDVACPKYVLDSLFELLSITIECLNYIRDGACFGEKSLRKCFQTDVEKVANSLLLSHSYAKKSENEKNILKIANIDEKVEENHPKIAVPSDGTSSSSAENANLEDISTVTKYKSIIISPIFVALSDSMVSGNHHYSAYCLYCTKSFHKLSEWEWHCSSDNNHHSNIKKTDQKSEFTCDLCGLLVLGCNIIAKVYHEFHIKMHQKKSDPILEQPKASQTISEASVSPTFDIVLSENFKHISKFTIRRLKSGFYCGTCDTNYFNTKKWNDHFQLVPLHHKPEGKIMEDRFKMCDLCSFVIFAPSHQMNELLSFHKNMHQLHCSQEVINTGVGKNVEPLGIETLDSEDVVTETYRASSYNAIESLDNSISSNRGSIQNLSHKNKGNDYIICDLFTVFSNKIHSKNLIGAYFCRPCMKCHKTQDDWEEHCSGDKHIQFMNSKLFKNFQGRCTFCGLTIVGTERTVHEYFKFHSLGHKKVSSYSLTEVGKASSNENKPKKLRKRRGKKSEVYASSTTLESHQQKVNCDTAINESHQQKVNCDTAINESHNDNVSINSLNSEQDSWYTSSRDEKIISQLRQLYIDRLKEKKSGSSPSYGAYCIPCEVLKLDAFDWIDHLSSNEHFLSCTPVDEEISYSDFNLIIFGRTAQIPDFFSC